MNFKLPQKTDIFLGNVLITLSIFFLFFYFLNSNIGYDIVYDSIMPKDADWRFFFISFSSDTLGQHYYLINIPKVIIFLLELVFKENVFLIFNILSISVYAFTIYKIFEFYKKTDTLLDKFILSLFFVSPISLYFNKIIVPYSLLLFGIYMFLKINEADNKKGVFFCLLSTLLHPGVFVINSFLLLENKIKNIKYIIFTIVFAIFLLAINFKYTQHVTIDGFAYWVSRIMNIEIINNTIMNYIIIFLYLLVWIWFCYKSKINYGRICFVFLINAFCVFIFSVSIFFSEADYFDKRALNLIYDEMPFFLIWHKISIIILLYYILLIKWSENIWDKLIIISLLMLSIININYYSTNKFTRILDLNEQGQIYRVFNVDPQNMLEINTNNFIVDNKYSYSKPFSKYYKISENNKNDICLVYYKFDDENTFLINKMKNVENFYKQKTQYIIMGEGVFDKKLFEKIYKYKYFVFNKKINESCEVMLAGEN